MRWAPALAGMGTVMTPLLGQKMWVLATALVIFGFGLTVYLRFSGNRRAVAGAVGAARYLARTDRRGRAGCLRDRDPRDRVRLRPFRGNRALYIGFGGLLMLTAILWSGFNNEYRQGLNATPLHPGGPAQGSAALGGVGDGGIREVVVH